MDIDVVSRLMHEQYLAESNYKSVGMMNAYGLNILEAKELEVKFNTARIRREFANLQFKYYAEEDSLIGAQRRAAYKCI